MYDRLQNYFIYGGLDSRKYNCYVFDKTTRGSGARQYQRTQVLGRDGDLVISNGRVGNVTQEYSCVITERGDANLRRLRGDIMALEGYQRLEDTIHKDEFYEAFLDAEINPVMGGDMAKFTLAFSRKPQRWLKLWEQGVFLDSTGGDFYNPTPFPAKPVMTITGYGDVDFFKQAESGSYVLQTRVGITGTAASEITIDSQMMESYSGTTPMNDKVTLSDLGRRRPYPLLYPGVTHVDVVSETIRGIVIRPRLYSM